MRIWLFKKIKNQRVSLFWYLTLTCWMLILFSFILCKNSNLNILFSLSFNHSFFLNFQGPSHHPSYFHIHWVSCCSKHTACHLQVIHHLVGERGANTRMLSKNRVLISFLSPWRPNRLIHLKTQAPMRRLESTYWYKCSMRRYASKV